VGQPLLHNNYHSIVEVGCWSPSSNLADTSSFSPGGRRSHKDHVERITCSMRILSRPSCGFPQTRRLPEWTSMARMMANASLHPRHRKSSNLIRRSRISGFCESAAAPRNQNRASSRMTQQRKLPTWTETETQTQELRHAEGTVTPTTGSGYRREQRVLGYSYPSEGSKLLSRILRSIYGHCRFRAAKAGPNQVRMPHDQLYRTARKRSGSVRVLGSPNTTKFKVLDTLKSFCVHSTDRIGRHAARVVVLRQRYHTICTNY